MEAIKLIELENQGRAKLKCELRRLKINFYFSESTESLERKLAYARTHQTPAFRRLFYKK